MDLHKLVDLAESIVYRFDHDQVVHVEVPKKYWKMTKRKQKKWLVRNIMRLKRK